MERLQPASLAHHAGYEECCVVRPTLYYSSTQCATLMLSTKRLYHKIYKASVLQLRMERAQEFHAGVIGFAAAASLNDIKSAARKLAKLPEFACIWVRRIDDLRWGIEFLTRCNKDRECEEIVTEVSSWLRRVEPNRPRESSIGAVSASRDVILIKLPRRVSDRCRGQANHVVGRGVPAAPRR